MRHLACALVFALLFAAAQPALASDRETGQLCWAVGKLDDTVYYAGVEEREDRSESFASLIEISALETHPVKCAILPVAEYRALRLQLVSAWRGAELEVVDTTYMSGMDY